MIGHIQLDRTQVASFVHYMIGFECIGIAGDQEVDRPVCPEMRAFIIGILGEKTPSSGHTMIRNKDEMRNMAAFLRSVADNLDDFITDDKTT